MLTKHLCYKWVPVTSPRGALLQDGKPIAFISSQLSATEVNNAPIEKELFAINVACTNFYQYLYEKQDVIVHSDHQPLKTIFKNH